jgi:type 1 glutamine amidotransferase
MVAQVPPTVLVVSETAGFHHDSIPAQQRFLRSLRGLRVVVLDRVAQLTAVRLRTARAVVFASTSGSPRFNATGRRALLRFVRGGGGFVGTHSASDTFAGWPDFVRLLGTRFSHHTRVERRRVVVADRRHSVTRGLGASFPLVDEYYRFVSAPRAHVLLRDGRGGPPLAWVRSEGRGRVFYSALGHPIGAWSDPHVRRLVSQGVRWVARLR